MPRSIKVSEALRLVRKAEYGQQTFLSIPSPDTPLGASSIRVRTILIGLTANNLAYCLGGDLLHWWSCFPLPPSTPAEYGSSEYGIAPAWGYSIVLGSTVAGIEPGRVVYGFLPMSSHSVDLQLQQTESMRDHFIETSSHRSKVMNLYQRYTLMPMDFDLSSKLTLWTAVFKTAEAGSSIARYLFPQDGSAPIHPFGLEISPWGQKEADLNGACIICLASGTKTARAFIYELATIAAHQEPKYTLVEVTSDPVGCTRYLSKVLWPHKVIEYAAVSDPYPPHRKFIILDFGGRDNALKKAAESVKKSYPTAELICISIGGEAKVYDEVAAKQRSATAAELKTVQMNAGAIRDVAMARKGQPQYFAELEASFKNMVDRQTREFDDKLLGMRLKVHEGLRGVDGVEGIWDRLSKGQIPGDDGIAVVLDVQD